MQYVLAGKHYHYHPVKLTGIVVPYKWLPGKCIDSRGLYNCPTFNECSVYTVEMLPYCSMQVVIQGRRKKQFYSNSILGSSPLQVWGGSRKFQKLCLKKPVFGPKK